VALVVALLYIVYSAQISTADARAVSPIDPALAAVLSRQSASQPVSVIVVLKDQANLRAISGRTRRERQKNVIRALRSKADSTQRELRALLKQRGAQGKVRSATPLWVMNGFAVTANQEVIDELAQSPLVRRIVLDAAIQAPPHPNQAAAASAAEPNLTAINAPALWELGYRGQGIVVANMDTGVDVTHPDLSARWRGGSNSWYDPYGQHVHANRHTHAKQHADQHAYPVKSQPLPVSSQ